MLLLACSCPPFPLLLVSWPFPSMSLCVYPGKPSPWAQLLSSANSLFPRPHQSAHPQSTVQARAMWALPLPITHLLRGNPSVLWDSQFCRSKSSELRSGVNGQCAAGNGFPLSGGPSFCPWEPPLGSWELSARRTCIFPVQCSPGHCRLKEFMCPFQNMKYRANLQHHWVPLPLTLQ